ncbi:hypothetical protein J5N97_030023 [Dioscorea zingiberensis]|uniref:Mei2-like C-terminal RNA recognition motif domain-containing protein n=1 Tax=Dioscorea zingiberensis TaxID=325984 RepID=A0A9D5BWX0_9LILI|nr:hypothetical protein J5N97_030023 [Dioscorea zingiberensis]
MAPLNPDAPFYFPYYYSYYSSSPPYPYAPPALPFHFYFPPYGAATTTTAAAAAAFFYAFSSLPAHVDPNQCYYEAPIYTLQSQVRTKQWVALPGFEGMQEGVQLPIIEDYEQKKMSDQEKGKKGGFWYSNPPDQGLLMKGDNNNTRDLVGLKRVWIPKLRWQNRMLALPVAEDVFQFKDEVEDEDHRTTIMMKNLPNKLMKNKLLEMLDEHCSKENQKFKEEAGVLEAGVLGDIIRSEFDFLYLPMDFESGSNLGYAFVNFTSAAAARRLHYAYHNKAWSAILFGSHKICEVTYARIQGLPALQRRFRNSIFICDSDEYLPVFFIPSRNGGEYPSEQRYIGKRIAKPCASGDRIDTANHYLA